MFPTIALAVVSSKEMQSRPLTVNRSSVQPVLQSPIPGRPPHTYSHARNLSTSLATSSAHNATHRVTRRKSMTGSSANRDAVVAALKEVGSLPVNAAAARARAASKRSRSGSPTGLPAQNPKFSPEIKPEVPSNTSAVEDDHMSGDEKPLHFEKARVRRASDGQPLSKDGRKSNRVELRCEQCGKGYKHSSCLTKHLWEHTPQWSYTSKLLISKHQQVQLLEAASVLVAMNNNASEVTTPPDSARDFNSSDRESASPAASGYSDLRAGQSSANTTPPPQTEVHRSASGSSWDLDKRLGGKGLSFPLARQAAMSNMAASAPNGSCGFGHLRQLSVDHQPISSGLTKTVRDDGDLSATLEMLSCSVGSNLPRSIGVPADAPPVPPLPAQYLDQVTLGTSFLTMGSIPTQPESFARGEHVPVDAKVYESSDSITSIADEEDFEMRSRARSDEDDDGIFGRMEE